ncbi:hypothetical protein BDK51DRAFT_14713, partial [Blyttiomyces helicus]
MSTKEQLRLWDDGLQAYRVGDLDAALEMFQSVGDYSRINFNIAMIFCQTGDHASAVEMLTQSLSKDPFLAVAYFQRGYSEFMLGDYEMAEEDFTQAIELLRENDSIDYTQLSLSFELRRSEVLHNRAMCAHQLGDMQAATDDMNAAMTTAANDHKMRLGTSMRSGITSLSLFAVPGSTLFEVAKSKIANLEKKSFLKDAKVLLSTDGEEKFSGFSGAAIL